MNTDREIVRRALQDAIDYQRSVAESWSAGTPEFAIARERIEKYRRVLSHRYGITLSVTETFDRHIDETCVNVSLDQIAAKHR